MTAPADALSHRGDGRPVLIDAFCCQGGAGEGYARAGFRVVGVDKDPQPRYPHEFFQADAIHFLAEYGHLADAIHASPPCQFATGLAKQQGTSGDHLNLIPPTRNVLRWLGLPYVIENVEDAAAHLHNPHELCGTHFGLGVFRHRLFEISGFPMLTPPHLVHTGRIGDGTYVTVTGKPGGSSRRDGIKHGDVHAWRRAMDIGWMTYDGLAQAIPPAYTQFIGEALLAALPMEVAL